MTAPMMLSAQSQHFERSVITLMVQVNIGATAAPDLTHRWHLELTSADGSARLPLSDVDFRMTLPIPSHGAGVGCPPSFRLCAFAGQCPALLGLTPVPSFRLRASEHISLRGEYRFTDFGSGQLGLPTVNGINLNDFVSARASPTMQDGRLSLNYRF